MREVELKRRERLRVGWAVSLGILGILLSSVGSAKADSKITPAQIKRAVELRIASRKCDAAFRDLLRAKRGIRFAKATKACAPLLPEGACRSAFPRREKALSVCLDTFCGELVRNKPSARTKKDRRLCRRRKRVKKTVVEALLARRIEADLRHYLSGPQAKKYASSVLMMLSRRFQPTIQVEADDPRLHVTLGRPWTLFVDNDGRTNIVSTGSRHWRFTGPPTPRAVDAMVKEFKGTVDKQGGASQVQIFANKKVPDKLVSSLIDSLRRAGMKHVVLAHEKE